MPFQSSAIALKFEAIFKQEPPTRHAAILKTWRSLGALTLSTLSQHVNIPVSFDSRLFKIQEKPLEQDGVIIQMMRRKPVRPEGLIRYVSNRKGIFSEGYWDPNGESYMRIIFKDGSYFMGFTSPTETMAGTQGSSSNSNDNAKDGFERKQTLLNSSPMTNKSTKTESESFLAPKRNLTGNVDLKVNCPLYGTIN